MDKIADEQLLLLQKVSRGDEKAFEQFYRCQVAQVRSFLLKKGIVDTMVCNDLIQETFLRVWSKSTYYQSYKGSPRSWLIAIAQNCLFDYWRKLQRMPPMIELEDHLPKDTEQSRIDGLSLDETSIIMRKAIGNLNKKDQHLIQNIYSKGYTIEEYASAHKIPPGTIKWKLREIKRKMKSFIGKP